MSTSEKRNCIDVTRSGLSVAQQCKLIKLPRSSYYHPKRKSEGEGNQHLMHLIDEEFARHPFTGTRRMTGWLRRQGWQVNRKRVQRLMQLMGLHSTLPGPNTSKPRKEHKKYPYLLKEMDIDRPNQVWATDTPISV